MTTDRAPEALPGSTPVDQRVGRPVSELHVCDDCGHSGTEPSATESYCGHCGATVPYPQDDHCAECGHDNCMLLACPECGGQFRPAIELVDDSMTPNDRAKPTTEAAP